MNKTSITDPRDIINYLKGGAAEFTLKSIKTGTHHTFKFVRMPAQDHRDPGYFVLHLTGPDNTIDFSYLCIATSDCTRTVLTKASPGPTDSFKAITWFLKCLDRRCDKLSQVEFYHTGKCSACGRKLTTPESVARGMGPVCRQRVGG